MRVVLVCLALIGLILATTGAGYVLGFLVGHDPHEGAMGGLVIGMAIAAFIGVGELE